MLKSLIIVVLTGMAFSAHARMSDYDFCMNNMKYYFLASDSEATTVCRQNSTPEFTKCMVMKSKNSNDHVLEAAPQCSRPKLNIPIEKKDSNYVNLKSCPSKLQMRARMSQFRSRQICEWDSTPIMQTCLIDLVEKARFHSEHAIQYCGFAKSEYRNKIPQFTACLISNSKRGYDVYSNVMNCDARITGTYVAPRTERRPEPQPEVRPRPEPRPEARPKPMPMPKNDPRPNPVPQDDGYDTDYEPAYPTQPETRYPTQPEVRTPARPEVRTVPSEEPAPKSPSNGRTVPSPVDIKIEQSSKPEVNDQAVETGTTSNSESLPL